MVNRSASKSPPSTPQESTGKEDKRSAAGTTTTTSGKKMKQTRLSFAAKDGTAASGGSAAVLRKRKLSSPEGGADRTVKIVRREGDPPPPEDNDPVVVIDDEVPPVVEKKEEEEEEVVPMEQEDGVVEIIPCEEENSEAAPASSVGDVSLVEEEEDGDSKNGAGDQEGKPENPDESVNLDTSSSEDGNSEGDTGGKGDGERSTSMANMLEPPSNANGKPLTPRQLEKFMERKSKHEEKLRLKMEREKKLEDERKQREERERQKKREKEEREEAKRREREEKENAKQREKEEKENAKQREKEERERKKQLDLEQKNEEKRRREEQKEEERRRKEEEKRQKEIEEENKRKRASQAFTKFFKVGSKATNEEEGNAGTQSQDDVVEVVNQYFMPFAVKGDMKLAPTVRRVLSKESKGALDKILQGAEGGVPDLYLKSLKTKSHVPLKGVRTWNTSDSSDDDSEDELMIVDDGLSHGLEKEKTKQKYRAKCLMFKENRRPAYYGTWQKKSRVVGPRTPFAKDEKYFDYEVDSDDEWEEEEPGESLHGSDDEKEKESEDDYEVDNDFFVPHGHLSDEELKDGDNEMDDNSPEAQKVKLKLLQDEFNVEMKKKTEKIKPRLIGCIWMNEQTGGRPENCPQVFWDLLQFRAILSAGPIVLRQPPKEDAAAGEGDAEADAEEEQVDKRKGQSLTEEEVRDLIRLVHGNLNSNKFMVKEFQKYREKEAGEGAVKAVTNMSILRKIKEIANWENGCWAVRKEFLERYQASELPLENKWAYSLVPKRTKDSMVARAEKKSAVNSPQVVVAASGGAQQVVENGGGGSAPKTPVRPPVEKGSPPSAKQKSSKNSITQFTKVLTTEEKQKQFQSISISSPKVTTTGTTEKPNENQKPPEVAVKTASPAPPPVAKKRVPLLMSVPRGQAISEQSKNLLIQNFLKKPEEKELKKPLEEGKKLMEEPKIVDTIVLD